MIFDPSLDYKIDGARTYAQHFCKPIHHWSVGKLPGDPQKLGEHQLDGWEHKNFGNFGVGWSRDRIPTTMDPCKSNIYKISVRNMKFDSKI